MNIYSGADNAIRTMNRQNLKLFGKLKLAHFDELNVIRHVNATYDESTQTAKRKYYEIAFDAYIGAMLEAKFSNKEAMRLAEETITTDWVLDMLEEVDPVTLYAFLTETERKKQRLIEALAVAHNRNAEIDKALKYWTQQVGQYADNSVYRARYEAFMAAGVERVRWVTQEDNRVCGDCDELNGRIFDIEDVPPPLHYGCRCFWVPVFD